jgi:hypothetical protein
MLARKSLLARLAASACSFGFAQRLLGAGVGGDVATDATIAEEAAG